MGLNAEDWCTLLIILRVHTQSDDYAILTGYELGENKVSPLDTAISLKL